MELSILGPDHGEVTIQMGGEFTFSESSKFREMLKCLALKKPTYVSADLSQTEYIDSAALGMLLLLKEHCDEMGVKVELSGASGQVLQILELSRFQDLFILNSDPQSKPAA